jgi:hypothetical protein
MARELNPVFGNGPTTQIHYATQIMTTSHQKWSGSFALPFEIPDSYS